MRKNAFVLIAAIFAANTPLSAQAESIVADGVTYSSDGITYSYGADTALTSYYAPAPAYGYGDLGLIDQTEIVYAPQNTGYEVIEQSPVAYETAYDASYDAYASPAASDATYGANMTETIDGIVYETVFDGEPAVMSAPQIIQTY